MAKQSKMHKGKWTSGPKPCPSCQGRITAKRSVRDGKTVTGSWQVECSCYVNDFSGNKGEAVRQFRENRQKARDLRRPK